MKEAPTSPWLTIWTRPRATIQAVVATGSSRQVLILAALSGASSFIPPGSYLVRLDLGMHMVMVVTAGPLSGIVSLHLAAGLLAWAGHWLGGTSPQSGLRAALAWASVPGIVIAPVQLAGLPIYGKFIFYPAFPGDEEPADMQMARVVLLVLGWGAMAWASILAVKCVSQVQRFSSWRSIASHGIAFGVLILVGFVVVALILLAEVAMS